AAERDNEDRVRRRLTAQRVHLMEQAMEAIGFHPDGVTWSVGRLLALLASNWQPVVRSLDRLAKDRELAINSKTLANRKRSFRRAVCELADWGLIRFEVNDGVKRVKTRRQAMFTIELQRSVIAAEAAGEEVVSAVSDADEHADEHTDETRTSGRTSGRTDSGRVGGQTGSHSLLETLTYPKPSSPSSLQPAETATTKDLEITFDADTALRAAGVERVTAAMRLADQLGVADEDLVRACVVATCDKRLEGGAVFDWIRSGGWPVSGVRSFDRLRQDAARVRERLTTELAEYQAKSGKRLSADAVTAITVRRLTSKGLRAFATSDEVATAKRIEERKREREMEVA
ncbi:MAG: hypothetical protein AAFN70_18630, partial [Planctomycetota bacterium]